MATKYPDGIDNTTSLPYITNGTSPMVAEDINRLRDAVVAVETELGADPSGTFTSVAARVAANEQSISEYARSEFLVLSHDGYVSRERVFVPSADFAATDGGPGFNYDLDLADVVGIGTSTPDAGYSLTLDGDGSSRIGGLVLRDAGTDTFFLGSPAAGNTSDIVLSNPNSGYLGLESGGDVTVDGAAVVVTATGAVEIQGASVDVDSTGPVTIGASASAVEVGAAGADTSVLGDLVVEENIDVTSGKITFSNDLSIGSYPAGFAGFGAPLPLPYSVADSVSSVIVNTQNEEVLLTTNLSGIFGLNTDDWTLLGLDNGRTVATNKYGGIGGPTSSATMFSAVAPFGVVGTMIMGSADPDDGFGSAIESAENLAIAALGDTALLLANNSSGTARVKIGAINGSGPASTDDWSTKYGDSSVHVTKIADFVHNGSAQIQVAVGGGVAAPEYSFSGAENTGLFYSAPGTVSLSADGLEVLRAVNSSSIKKVIIGPEEDDSAVESIVAATSRPDGGTADSVGAHLYLRAGAGLGTGQGGSVVLQVAPPASVSGQSQNAFSNILMANANSATAPRYLGVDASVVTLNGPVANNTSVNIGTQASTSGVTKLINIGTGGLSGSTAEIEIGVAGDARVALNTSDRDIIIGAGDGISMGAGDSVTVTSGRYITLDATTGVEIIAFDGSSGTVSTATSNTISVSTSFWSTNQWAGWGVSVIDGAGARQSRSIVSNTASTLTVSPAWTVIPTALSNFAIKRGGLALSIGSDIVINSTYGDISIDADAGYISLISDAADDLAIQISAENGGINVVSPDIVIQSGSLTASSTLNLGSHAATAGTKTINIGTGATGSAITNVNIGSASGGATTVNGALSCTGILNVGDRIEVSEIEADGASLTISAPTATISATTTSVSGIINGIISGFAASSHIIRGMELYPANELTGVSSAWHIKAVLRVTAGAIRLPNGLTATLVTATDRNLSPGAGAGTRLPAIEGGTPTFGGATDQIYVFARMKTGETTPSVEYSLAPPDDTGKPTSAVQVGYASTDYGYLGMFNMREFYSLNTGIGLPSENDQAFRTWRYCTAQYLSHGVRLVTAADPSDDQATVTGSGFPGWGTDNTPGAGTEAFAPVGFEGLTGLAGKYRTARLVGTSVRGSISTSLSVTTFSYNIRFGALYQENSFNVAGDNVVYFLSGETPAFPTVSGGKTQYLVFTTTSLPTGIVYLEDMTRTITHIIENVNRIGMPAIASVNSAF